MLLNFASCGADSRRTRRRKQRYSSREENKSRSILVNEVSLAGASIVRSVQFHVSELTKPCHTSSASPLHDS